MKVVLLSGGSGKRLWPMSNDSRSKQFLRVLRDESGQPISMLQRVWRQLAKVGLQQDTFVCASKAQMDVIESQLQTVPCIEEPNRRDTFPAIAIASTYLLDIAGCPEDEVVAVVPIDHFVDDTYYRQIADLEQVIAESGAELALMGVVPEEPTSKFGYIKVATGSMAEGAWREVDSFVEKPTREVAAELIGAGSLWNCGIFCFRLSYLRDILTNGGYPSSYEKLKENFDTLPKRSFDYEVAERAKRVVVMPYQGFWKDLGTWGALSEEIEETFVGKGDAVDCENTHVINELGIPLVAMGLADTMIVATPDGIFVGNKESSTKIKDVVNIFEGRPMYEERKWGSYRVLDFQKLADGTEVLTKCIILNEGSNISYQKHRKRSEVWTIIEGTGEMVLDSKMVTVHPGDIIRIHPEQWHAIRAIDRLMFIEVQRGAELVEEDIVRRYLTWDEVGAHCNFLVV